MAADQPPSLDPVALAAALAAAQARLVEVEAERDRARAGEAWFRTLFEAFDEGVFVADAATGTIEAMNPRASAELGYTLAELPAALSSLRVTEPGFTAEDFQVWTRKVEREGPQCFEWKGKRRDGSLYWVELMMQLVHIEGVAKRLSVVRYIDDRKREEADAARAAAAVVQAERRYRKLLEYSADVVSVLDATGQVTFVTRSIERVLGLAPAEVLDAPLVARVHPDDVATVTSLLADLATRPDGVAVATFRLRAADGAWRTMEATAHNLLDDRDIGGVVLNQQDVSARVEAERARARKRDQLRLALGAARMVVFTADFVTDVFTISPEARSVLGIEPDQYRTVSAARRLIHPADAEEVDRSMRGEPGSEADLRFRMVRPDTGEVLWIERRLQRVHDATGQLVGAHGVIIDITEQRRIEALQRHSVELEAQNRRIADASRLKSEFLANMSHELRTPLNVVIGFAELLHDGHVEPTSPAHGEFIADILASGRHLLRLINDVLDLAKVEAGKLRFEPEVVDIAQLVREVLAGLAPLASAVEVTLSADVAVDGTVVLDPGRARQVLYNYLSNALKFTPAGGVVQVRARRERLAAVDAVRLEVHDTGIGIDVEQLPQLFVEFHQLDGSATKKYPGTGLGLALTRRLVEAQGGRVGVASTRGRGSVFWASLPCGAPSTPRPDPGAPSPPPVRSILVVEDARGGHRVLARLFGDAGYEVVEASTGAAALAWWAQRAFDAIALELWLPDMSALELIGALRAVARGREVPIIVASSGPASPSPGGDVAGFAVRDVVPKPMDDAAVLGALTRAGASPARRDVVLVVDDEPAALRLMQTALSSVGYQVLGHGSAEAALVAAAEVVPSAIVLDLLMPGVDGFEFLRRLRAVPALRRVPVLVWTAKTLTLAERGQLTQAAQGVVAKGDGARALLDELRGLLEAAAAPGGNT